MSSTFLKSLQKHYFDGFILYGVVIENMQNALQGTL